MTEPSNISASKWQIAAEWLERADGDLRIAEGILTYNAEILWGAALHCQQALEKMAKGTLIAAGKRPPRSHDIAVLASLVEQENLVLGRQIGALVELTAWYFAARHPSGADDSLPSLEEVKIAIAKLKNLRHQINSFAPKPNE